MRLNIENLIKKIAQKGSSATLLIACKKQEDQLVTAEDIATRLLNLNGTKSYKAHPDVFGIWPENIDGRTIKIEQIHVFIRKTQFKPYSAKFKIGIIASAEKMTPQAQNALLKTLEEPPENTFLILTTTSPKKLLQTIVSRCQVLEIFDKGKIKVDQKRIKNILKQNIVERFQFVEELIKEKDPTKKHESINTLLENLLSFFRERLLKKVKKEKEREKIIEIIRLIATTQQAIAANVNLRLALENLMISLPLRGEDY